MFSLLHTSLKERNSIVFKEAVKINRDSNVQTALVLKFVTINTMACFYFTLGRLPKRNSVS